MPLQSSFATALLCIKKSQDCFPDARLSGRITKNAPPAVFSLLPFAFCLLRLAFCVLPFLPFSPGRRWPERPDEGHCTA